MADFVGYLAPEGFLPELQQELGAAVREIYGNLVLAVGPIKSVARVANVWHDPVHMPISSIGDAAHRHSCANLNRGL